MFYVHIQLLKKITFMKNLKNVNAIQLTSGTVIKIQEY